MDKDKIRLVIAGEHRLFRQGLVALLEDHGGFRVEGEAASAPEAVRRVLEVQPDVAVLDNRERGMNGIEVARKIAASPVRTGVIVLDDRFDQDFRKRASEAGARGYLPKACSFEDLVRAIRQVARGDDYPREIARPGGASEAEEPTGAGQAAEGSMTRREREIAVLLADGYSSKEAAAALGIGVRTAEAHRASILRKLGARNVADIVKYCIRNRLIDL